MSFTDNFIETSDTDLENRAGWTLVSGAAGGIFARAATDTARALSTSAYNITNQGSSDFNVEITIESTAFANSDCYAVMAFQDDDNFVAFQITTSGSAGARLVVRIAGVDQTPEITAQATAGAIYRIEKRGTTYNLFIDTVPEGGDITISDFSTESDIGLVAKGASNNNWVSRLFAEGVSSGTTVVTTGTAVPSQTEADIVTGGETIILTLTDDTWAAAGTGPIGSTADTQAIIDGLDSAQSELTGWNNEVRDKEVTTAVVRTSSTVCTITLTASAAYDITSTETITATIPAAALVTSVIDVEATPTFTVTPVVSGVSIPVIMNSYRQRRA